MAIGSAFNNTGGTGSNSRIVKTVVFTDQTSLTITHNFENTPTVIIIDSSGYLVHAEVQHASSGQILINFSISLSGTVFIR